MSERSREPSIDDFFSWDCMTGSVPDRIISVVRVRDVLIVTTEWNLYHVRADPLTGWSIQKMTYIP